MKKESQYTNKGFKVPEKYFDTLENTILEKINDLDSNLGILKNIQKPHGYVVPESYFNNDVIEKRLLENELLKPSKKVISLQPWKKVAFSIAAIAASLLLLFSIFTNDSTTPPDAIASVDQSLIKDYVDNGDLDLSLFEVEDILLDQNIDISALNDEAVQEDFLFEYLEERIENEYILTE